MHVNKLRVIYTSVFEKSNLNVYFWELAEFIERPILGVYCRLSNVVASRNTEPHRVALFLGLSPHHKVTHPISPRVKPLNSLINTYRLGLAVRYLFKKVSVLAELIAVRLNSN